MKLLFDIETDGLEYTKIWCLVAQEVDTGEVWSYGPDEIEEGVQLLNGAEQLSGHNIIGFDIPALEELTSFKLGSQRIIDTLVLSRLFNPVREGGHSLAVWGGKLGLSKIEFKEFESYSPQMLEYCKRDVAVNVKVYKSLQREGVGFDPRSIVLETETARILKDQEKNGFYFDEYAADMLLALMRTKMKDAEDEVTKVFKPKMDERLIYRKNTANGSVAKIGCWDTPSGAGVRLTPEEHAILSQPATFSTTRVTTVDFSISSRKQIGEYLIEFGWKPEEFTVNGRPVVNEKTLSQIKDIPQAELIKDYLMYQKREAQIKSWIKALKEDGRVHGYVNSNGTITGRMTHNNPNMAQVPSSGSPYGKECRACWTVPKGYKLVGIDASGLELRMLAHYMKDAEYVKTVTEGSSKDGTDVHTVNQRAAGLATRDNAKTFIYAFLYGAGDSKIGSIVGGSAAAGKKLKQSFLSQTPALLKLITAVSGYAAKGFVPGLDGRMIWVRSEHAALNSLLQGAGAVVMKKALVLFNEQIIKNKWPVKMVVNVHDEFQWETTEKYATITGEAGKQAIVDAGLFYNLRCPLDGEYKIGKSWRETH